MTMSTRRNSTPAKDLDGVAPPTMQELERIFLLKHGDHTKAGWSVRRRFPLRYFTPDDWYDALLSRLVQEDTNWLDLGGGRSPLPHNPALARDLAARCALLTG